MSDYAQRVRKQDRNGNTKKGKEVIKKDETIREETKREIRKRKEKIQQGRQELFRVTQFVNHPVTSCSHTGGY